MSTLFERPTWTRAAAEMGVATGLGVALLGLMVLFVEAQAPVRVASSASSPAMAEPTAPAMAVEVASKLAPPADPKRDVVRGEAAAAAEEARPTRSAPPPPSAGVLAAQPQKSHEGVRLRFRSEDALLALAQGGYVDVLVEFADGSRHEVPISSAATNGQLHVPDDAFAELVRSGRVTEITPTPEIRERLGLHLTEIRLLVVLGREVATRLELARATTSGANGAVFWLDVGPEVTVER